jgi:hypothetical protein
MACALPYCGGAENGHFRYRRKVIVLFELSARGETGKLSIASPTRE